MIGLLLVLMAAAAFLVWLGHGLFLVVLGRPWNPFGITMGSTVADGPTQNRVDGLGELTIALGVAIAGYRLLFDTSPGVPEVLFVLMVVAGWGIKRFLVRRVARTPIKVAKPRS